MFIDVRMMKIQNAIGVACPYCADRKNKIKSARKAAETQRTRKGFPWLFFAMSLRLRAFA
jgi:hypothetical protein